MRYVIAGAGAAGSACARALRDLAGPESEIVVLEAVAEPPPSPALLPEFAAGAVAPEMLPLAQAWKRAGAVHRRPLAPHLVLRTRCRLRAVDPDRQVVQVYGGEELAYDRLLLATGGGVTGLPRWATAAGITGQGVLNMSSWRQAGRLRRFLATHAADRSTVLVIGAGPTGLRVADALLGHGLRVVLSEALGYPLGMLGSEGAGAAVMRVAAEAGIRVLMGAHAARAERGPDGKLEGITHVSGSREEFVRCDVAVLCTGSEPAIPRVLSGFSRHAGRGRRRGSGLLHVDEGMRTAVPGIWAAGDIALPDGWDRPPGLWHVAAWQGRQAALTMAGRSPAPPPARVDLTVRFHGHLIWAWRPYALGADPVSVINAGSDLAPWHVTVAPAAVAAEPPRAAPLYLGVADGAN